MSNYVTPYSLLYAKLWDYVEQHPWSNIVKPGNRIRFDADTRSILKERCEDSDLPELVLLQQSGTHHLHADASYTYATRRLQWLVSTGELQIDDRLYAVEWMLLEAMTAADESVGALEWRDETYVKRFDLIDATEGLSDAERNRKIRGWSAALTIEIEMHFRTADLIAAAGVT